MAHMQEPGKIVPLAPKPVWWKVIVGGLLVLSEIGSICGRARALTGNRDQVQGMQAMEVILLLLGCWLIYSGTQPLRSKKSN